jgi:hypothetical protein
MIPDRCMCIHFNASYVCQNSAQVLKTILKTGQYTKFSLTLFCRYKKYRQVFLIVNIILIIYQIVYKHGYGYHILFGYLICITNGCLKNNAAVLRKKKVH